VHYAGDVFEVVKWSESGFPARIDAHYIVADGRIVAQYTTSNAESPLLQYFHRDHLGSVVATTDDEGDVLARWAYDPFGARTLTSGDPYAVYTQKGYTGHEHLDVVEMIHMNGRVQDPVLGRFLSPDPIVQAPYYSQSLNRYSYVGIIRCRLRIRAGFRGAGTTEEATALLIAMRKT
jgi:RHS repeat-associated protein